MQKYRLEFVLHTQESSSSVIKNSLAEFGEGLEIGESPQEANARGKDFKVHIDTEEPTTIFDICSQFGRIRKIKVHEIKRV
jgi:dihydroxyacetone kinase-like predicted kinase